MSDCMIIRKIRKNCFDDNKSILGTLFQRFIEYLPSHAKTRWCRRTMLRRYGGRMKPEGLRGGVDKNASPVTRRDDRN